MANQLDTEIEEMLESNAEEPSDIKEVDCFTTYRAKILMNDIKSLIEREVEKAKLDTQRKIFKGLDKLAVPPPLMAIVKDIVGVTHEEFTGFDELIKDEKARGK